MISSCTSIPFPSTSLSASKHEIDINVKLSNTSSVPSTPRLTAIEIAVEDSVATLTLARPEARNAIDPQLGEDLRAAAAWLSQRAPVRAAVLTGAGPAFCAGGDIAWFAETMAGGQDLLVDEVRRTADVLHQAVVDFSRVPFPTIAAVNGPAIGAGFSLALMCDIRLAAKGAVLSCGYSRIAATPDGGMTYFLPRILGAARATQLLFEDPELSASDAHRLGLVSEVVAAEELLDAARAFAARLAEQPARYLRFSKLLVEESRDAGLAEHLQRERHAIADSMATAETRERIEAFVARKR
jgi:enoyl-CoA hydratase/carnithine racemase